MGKHAFGNGTMRLKGSSNYANWKAAVEMHLRSEGVWGFVDGSNNEPPALSSAMSAIIKALEATDLGVLDRIKLEIEAERLTELFKSQTDEWQKRQFMAADMMFSAMDLPIQTLFETKKTDPKQLWDAAEKQFAEKGFTFLYDLVMSIMSLRLADSRDLEDYCTKFTTFQHQLAALRSEPPAEWYNSMFIGGLGSKFEIWQSRRCTDPTTNTAELETLMAEVREEARALESPTALLLQSKSSQKKDAGRVPGKSKTRGTKAAEQKKPEGAPLCAHCHNKGHAEANCWKKYPDKRPGRVKNDSKEKEDKEQGQVESIAAATSTNTDDFCAVTGSLLVADSSLGEELVVDSGATEHMARVREWFSTYTPLVGKKVRQGDGFLAVEGVGDVPLWWICSDGTEKRVTLKNVLHVPRLFTNLLSTSRVRKNGGYFNGRTDTFRRLDTNAEFGSTRMGRGFWLLNFRWSFPTTAVTAIATTNDLWHWRLGHASLSSMRLTAPHVDGMRLTSNEASSVSSCETCHVAKAHRVVSREPQQAPKDAFEIVHSDVAGHLKPIGFGHACYVELFTDGLSRCRWPYLMTHKDEAFPNFKSFYELVLTQFGVKIKKLHIDGGREYGMSRLNEFCRERGILLEVTAPYTPEEHGVSERANGVVATKARCMMKGLPPFLWSEAVKAACHILNCSFCRSVGKTPVEALAKAMGWKVKKPSISHFRAYGCLAYPVIPKEKRVTSEKFANRREVGVIVGYKGRKIYRIYIPSRCTVIDSPHVSFVESSHANFSDDADSVDDVVPTLSSSQTHRVHQESALTRWDDFAPTPSPQPRLERPQLLAPQEEPDEAQDDAEELAAAPKRRRGVWEVPEGGLRRSSRAKFLSSKAAENQAQASRLEEEGIVVAQALLIAAEQARDDAKNAKKDSWTWSEAMASPERGLWIEAAQKEYDSLISKHTWHLEPLPPGRHALTGKWVLTKKLNEKGEISRYKARWVVRGFEQKHGVDYFDTFAAVVKAPTYRVLFALVALYDWDCDHIDLETAFLNSPLPEEEQVFMQQPVGFEKKLADGTLLVCRLQRTLYGLKQSPQYCYQTLKAALIKMGLTRLESDHCVFIGLAKGPLKGVIVLVYVDDLLITCRNSSTISLVKNGLQTSFNIKDMGPVKFFLGVKVDRDHPNQTITLYQDTYIHKVLERFGLSECRPTKTPISVGHNLHQADDGFQHDGQLAKHYQMLIGSTMYAMIQMRPDIDYAIGVLSRFAHRPTIEHMTAGKHLLRYLARTKNAGLQYNFQGAPESRRELGLVAYTDSDWAGDQLTRRSTSGYVVQAGGGSLIWCSGLQATVALSSCEAEYYGLTNVTKEAIWLQNLLTELSYHGNDLRPMKVLEDNRAAIDLAKNPKFHRRTKQVVVRWHFCRDHQALGTTRIE